MALHARAEEITARHIAALQPYVGMQVMRRSPTAPGMWVPATITRCRLDGSLDLRRAHRRWARVAVRGARKRRRLDAAVKVRSRGSG